MTKKFTALPAAGALTGTEILALVQGGVSKQGTAQAIANLGSGGSGWPNTINVKDPPFNAVGNGIADDTAALNAAFASVIHTHALVLIPNGTYKITNTVVIGDTADNPPNSYISIMCPGGPEGVFLSWLGPNDGRPALYFAQNKYFTCQGFALDNNTGTKGSSIGIRIGGNRAAQQNTNQSIDGTFNLLFVRNFNIGITDGFDGAASEMKFISVTFGNDNTGWVMNKSNSLNHVFINTGGATCGTVFDTGSAINFTTIGGSISQSAIVSIIIRLNCTTGTIRGLRDEDSAMCVAADVNGGSVDITDSIFGGNITGPFAIGGISRLAAFVKLTLRDCSVGGAIQGNAGFLSIENCVIPFPDLNTRLPFTPSNSDTAPTLTHVYCKNNFSDGGYISPIDDFVGTLKPGEYTGGTVQGINQYMPHFLKRFQERVTTPNTGTPYGGDYICLGNVRHLSEGPVSGVKNLTPQITLVTNAPTAAGSNVLHFASVPTQIRPMMLVADDTTPGAIGFGNYVSRTIATTATTVTLNGNATGGGVLNGDTIRFWPAASVLNEGKNLRVTGTFAASTTSLAFTFVRSINVSNAGNGSKKLTINTGRFYPTDVGKAVKLVGSAANGWTDVFGYITNYIDSTHAEYEPQPMQTDVFAFTGPLNIGTNEPDANYIVLGITSDDPTPKSFSVTSITTTGFTITASAATSANVSALIVR